MNSGSVSLKLYLFPSPCGVRRVRDPYYSGLRDTLHRVSVPLRGKEGAGLNDEDLCIRLMMIVSVPLRGKEGAGLQYLNAS